MREQLEPDALFDDTYQDETRPALGDEARRALEIANARRNALQPIIDKDAETAAMMPNDYQKALQRLQQSRAPGASQPPASKPPREERSDPALALAQLTRQRDSGAPAPGPPSKPPGANGTGQNRAIARPPEPDIPTARDLASKVARRSLASVSPPAQAQSQPPPPIDDPGVIATIMGTHQPSTQSITGHTAPMMNMNALGLKSGGTGTGPNPLAPQRTPLPIAVGGGGGLKINAERPASMPPAGFGLPKTAPSLQNPSRPPGAAPAAAAASRPPGALPRTGPAAVPGQTPPKQYDFKRWSSPEINEMPNDGSPVTFEVYTAQDVANGRRPMRSLPMIETRPKSSGVALKVGLAILGIVIVLITAGAVIMVSTDDPKRPTTPPPSASAEPVGSAATPPTPGTIVIGDPTPPPEDSAAPSATTTTKPKPTSRPAPAPHGGGAPAAPVLPSNPYGAPGK